MKSLTIPLNVKVTGLHNIGLQSQYLNVCVSMFVKYFPVICDLMDIQFSVFVTGCCCYTLFEPYQLPCDQDAAQLPKQKDYQPLVWSSQPDTKVNRTH